MLTGTVLTKGKMEKDVVIGTFEELRTVALIKTLSINSKSSP